MNEATTIAVRGLAEKRIPFSLVATAAGVDAQTVRRVLDPDTCARCRPVTVEAVRRRVEALLAAAGWDGNAAELWADYEQAAA